MRTGWMLLVSGLVVGLLLAPAGVSAENFRLTIGAGHPVDASAWITSMRDYLQVEVKKQVESKTPHKIEWVEAYGGSVAKLGEVLAAIESGLMDIGDVHFPFEPAKLMAHNFPYFVPFASPDPLLASKAAYKVYQDQINNITGLGVMFERKGPLSRLVDRLYRIALRRSKKVFFQNRDDRDLFVERRLVRPEQVALLPGSGVDLDFFRPVPRSERDGITFLLAARLLWAKGVREFVEAARIVRASRDDAEFRILGPIEPAGPDAVARSDLEPWSKEGVIDYRGSAADVRPELAEADCVVLPSYYREGVPRILLDAAAMTIPVIAADSVGCRDAVKPGETGLLCEPRSVQSLATVRR